jgi:hypothetical protein
MRVDGVVAAMSYE